MALIRVIDRDGTLLTTTERDSVPAVGEIVMLRTREATSVKTQAHIVTFVSHDFTKEHGWITLVVEIPPTPLNKESE